MKILNKIKESFRKVYIENAEKSYKQIVGTWYIFCFVFLLCIFWYYCVKQQSPTDALINSYILYGFILSLFIRIIISILFFLLIFIIPSTLLWRIMITYPERKKRKSEEKKVKENKIRMINEREKIRHPNNSIDKIFN